MSPGCCPVGRVLSQQTRTVFLCSGDSTRAQACPPSPKALRRDYGCLPPILTPLLLSLLPSLGLVLPPYSTFYLQANLSDQILQVKCKWPGPCLHPAPCLCPAPWPEPAACGKTAPLPHLPSPQVPTGWGTGHGLWKVCGNLHACLFLDLVLDHSLMVSIKVSVFGFSCSVSSLLSLPPPHTPGGCTPGRHPLLSSPLLPCSHSSPSPHIPSSVTPSIP